MAATLRNPWDSNCGPVSTANRALDRQPPAVSRAPAPVTRRLDRSPAISMVATYEGVGVRTVGWIDVIRPQNKGTGESTNCHSHLAPETDWHIALVGHFGDGEKNAVVVETTPRVRRHHH